MPKCIHWGSTHLRPTVQSSRWVNSPSDIEKPWKNHSDDHHQRRPRRRESLTLMTHHLVFQSIYTIQHVVWNHKCFRLWLDECMCCMRLQKYVASNRQCCYHENTIMCMNTLASHWSGTFLPLGWLGVISQVPGSLDSAISTISRATSSQWNRNSTCSSSCKMHGFTMGSFNQIPPPACMSFWRLSSCRERLGHVTTGPELLEHKFDHLCHMFFERIRHRERSCLANIMWSWDFSSLDSQHIGVNRIDQKQLMVFQYKPQTYSMQLAGA